MGDISSVLVLISVLKLAICGINFFFNFCLKKEAILIIQCIKVINHSLKYYHVLPNKYTVGKHFLNFKQFRSRSAMDPADKAGSTLQHD